jgi:hypothetical protein
MVAAMPNATTVLRMMKREHLTLHAEHDQRGGKIVWSLSNGLPVHPVVAAALLHRPNIIATGDALPLGGRALCQTYRFKL